MQSKGDSVLHNGTFTPERSLFKEGDEVSLKVDEVKRRLHARLHSGGHLLDIAMQRIGKTELRPGKGYHYPAGAYDEYVGLLDMTKKDELI